MFLLIKPHTAWDLNKQHFWNWNFHLSEVRIHGNSQSRCLPLYTQKWNWRMAMSFQTQAVSPSLCKDTVFTELVQTFRNCAESNAAKGQTTAQWLHDTNSSTNMNMTSVCGLWEHEQLILKEEASAQSSLQRKQTDFVSSVGFWVQISRQVMHARKTLLLSMSAWLPATHQRSMQEKWSSS